MRQERVLKLRVRSIVILGSTGSIGRQVLDVVRRLPDRLRVVGLAARAQGDLVAQQAREFGVRRMALYDTDAARAHGMPGGMSALTELATLPEADTVVVSVAGVIGLEPTLAAIREGKRIALASKEVLVAAGAVVMPMLREHGAEITPIDSEHSAIFQCLLGYRSDQIDELILTASGGPFRGRTRADLDRVTVEDALNHPTWRMGGKITIDSATLMNKGLETIEARWLFDVPIARVRTVVHPQSVIHSMVKFRDGSVLGQLGWPDMRLPIQVALLHPERVASDLPPWNPVDTPHLTFEPLDETTFPAPRLARESVEIGGTMPCAMNAANEEAANAFLRGEVGFLGITRVVEETMARHTPVDPTLDHILAVDAEARRIARTLMGAPSVTNP